MENYLEMLKNGEIKPYMLDQIIFDKLKENMDDNDAWHEACKTASEVRLKWIEYKTGKTFKH